MGTATLTIDTGAIVANWTALDRASGGATETGAVVKADAYGLGAEQVATALARAGARRFFVAVAEEGAALRDVLGPGPEIFVFSGHMAGDTEAIRLADLIPLLNSTGQLTRHFEALPGQPFGIQLDTGMNRLGLEPAEWAAVREIVLGQGPKLVMSHLACADDPGHPMNVRQLALFGELTEGIAAPRSLAATGGIVMGPEYHFDVTRPGVGLYGGLPFEDARPVVRLEIPVVQVRQVAARETVGYANAWIAQAPSRIATISAGYADGLIRAMGDAARVFSGGVACPVVGRVSMDLITVDVPHLPGDPDTVEILGPRQTVDDLAEAAGTIGYEILTSLGARYERRYLERDG